MSSNIYGSLHESVRRWIDERQWNDFTAIQALAIPTILSERGALLVAPTAGGKTEAALLPIVSAILEKSLPPVSLLYVAPLRALINDQANRAQLLLRDTPLTSAWWHGVLPQSRRQAIAKNLPDALLTTPDSLEVHLSSPAYGQGSLLGNVRYILVDEIHAFADSDRGAQLVSLLTRLEVLMKRPFIRIGLSATIGNPKNVVDWFSSKRPDAPGIDVIEDGGTKARALHVGLVSLERTPDETAADYRDRVRLRSYELVAKHVVGRRSIVFVRSRAEAEILTAKLREWNIETLIHHGSLSVEMRRAAEDAMKRDEPETIVATSTLELGIDIGDLEQVIQLGPVDSVASWLQRIGRSGRSKDATSVGFMYALDRDELPLAIALCDLARTSTSEALNPDRSEYSVAFHQILNFVRERDKVGRDEIRMTLGGAGCFDAITSSDWETMVDEMIDDAFLERAEDKIQLGIETEKQFGFANYKNFYAAFEADSGWTVKQGQARIGNLPPEFPMPENREVRFVLGGSWWRVVAVDAKSKVVQVEPVSGGKAPAWRGGEGDVSFEVMQRAAALLGGADSAFITDRLRPHMVRLVSEATTGRVSAARIVVGDLPTGIEVVTYAGQRINRYLAALLTARSATEDVSPSAVVSASEIRIADSTSAVDSVVAFLKEAYETKLAGRARRKRRSRFSAPRNLVVLVQIWGLSRASPRGVPLFEACLT